MGSAGGSRLRRHDLDCIRVVAVVSVVIYHVGIVPVSYPAPEGAPTPVPLQALFNAATHPWRMALLFLVSGVVTRHMFEAMDAATFLGQRLVRLVPPLVFGLCVLVPTQFYVLFAHARPGISYWAVWASYVGLDDVMPVRGAVDLDFELSHLWFLLYLTVYVSVVATLARRRPDLVARLSSRIGRAPKGHLFLGPLIFLVAMRSCLFPFFADATGPLDDVYRHVVFFGLFAFGFLAAREDRFWQAMTAWRWVGLVLALGALAVFGSLTLTDGRGDGALAEQIHPFLRAVRPFLVWGAIAAALGFAHRHLRRGGPILAYLTASVMTVYLLHPLASALGSALLDRLALAGVPGLLVAVSLAFCLGAHEAIRRTPALHLWFGMRSDRPPSQFAAAARSR